MKIKRYNKKLDFSYAFGPHIVKELLEKKSEYILKILVKEEGLKDKNVLETLVFSKKLRFEYEINNKLIDKIASKENTYIVGVFKKFITKLEDNKNHVVLINPTSTGNLGTIMRSMRAFNFENLAIIKPSVDVFMPKVIRSSMGAFFHTNIELFNSIDEYIKIFQNHEIFPFMANGKYSINSFNFPLDKNITLVFGNESRGLDKSFDKYPSIFIPHNKNSESLNLGIATSIALYEINKKIYCG